MTAETTEAHATPEIAAAVAENLRTVRARIDAAATAAGRDGAAVTLVAVSKVQPLARVQAALDAGHRVFGENRVQEAQGRWTDLRPRYPDLRLHLIGPLQSNKAADAVALFDVIETVDRPKLARVLAEAMARQDRRLPCYVQVNTGEEPQKAGVAPAEADALIAACRDDYGLDVQGCMCIPPLEQEPAPHFALLREIARRNGLAQLSMGMSADYEVAVAFGATHVRLGTSIFGARETR
jgi:pyridoxal phosphate enzyme (YggS family)